MKRTSHEAVLPRTQSIRLQPRRSLEQQYFLNHGPLANRPNPEPLWKEVAERYQQIVEKDIKLLQHPSTVNAVNHCETGQMVTISLESKRVDNNQCLSRPVMFVPPEINERVTVAAGEKDSNATANFPKIVEVFSLNPSAPVRHFQEHVTVRVVPNGIIVEPHATQSLQPSNERTQNRKISENVKQKLRNFVDGHTTYTQDTYDRQRSLYKVYFQMEQCGATSTNHVDLKVALPEVISASPPQVNSSEELHSNCDKNKNSEQQNSIPTAENASTDTDKNTDSFPIAENDSTVIQYSLEGVNSNNNNYVKYKKKRRKRKSIFGTKRAKKKSRFASSEDITKIQYQELEDKTLSDVMENENVHSDNCDSMANGFVNNIDHNNVDINNEDHKGTLVNTNQGDGENLTKPNQEKRADKGLIENDKGNTFYFSAMLPCSHGNSVRRNRILDLKERLARQEQELEILRRKRESADARIEDCSSPTTNTADQNESEELSNRTDLNSDGQTKVTPNCSRTDADEEKCDEGIFYRVDRLDTNPGKLDDLKEIFQEVIKSFRIFETRLYITKNGIVIDNGDLQSKNVITDKSVFAHDNRMNLLPQDFPSKEEFLLQLGLLKI